MELQNMLKKVGLVNLKVEYHDLEMILEELLQSSFTHSDDIDNNRLLFKVDLAKNNLGMKSHLKNKGIYFYFPISMIVGNKI